MTLLDLPDSGLKEMDPRMIENVIKMEIEKIKPEVIVTYPVHGISGFHDHLVTHAVVKRVYLELRERVNYLKRLAFITLTIQQAEQNQHFHLNGSTDEEIDCIIELDQENIDKNLAALDCYRTYREMIEKSGIKDFIGKYSYFEIFGENFNPVINDLFDRL